MGYWLLDLIKQFKPQEPKRVVVKAPETRRNNALVSLEELLETYNGGIVFEYDEFKRYMQEKFGEVASNIFITLEDYEGVVEGLMDCYGYEWFGDWLDSRIQALNIDLSKERVKVVRNENDRLIVVKFDDVTETTH